jgi:MYXO-CTERM domain-containing protein
VVNSVTYRADGLDWTTFNADSTEELRLPRAVLEVRSGSTVLSPRADLLAEGYVVTPMPNGGIALAVRHASAAVSVTLVDAPDAGVDAGAPDAGTEDAGTSDAGEEDAGAADAGAEDAGTADAGAEDAGTGDAGTEDAGSADAGMTPMKPTGCGCATADVSPFLFALAVLAFLMVRRPRNTGNETERVG